MRHQRTGKRVTLQDIARKTGYSLTTVSRALRNMSDIGPEATARIQQTAREMGYVANQTAVALRYGRTNNITVILMDLTNPFYSIMANYIQHAAYEMGYSLTIACSWGKPELECHLVKQAIASRADGVLLFPFRDSGRAIEMLQAANVPFVLLAAALPPYQTDSIIIDDENGAHIATTHLIHAGCRKVAFLSLSSSVLSYVPRCRGFLRACEDAGIDEKDRYLCTFSNNDTSSEDDPNSLPLLLPRLKREGVEGLFIFCDIEAWRIMASLQRSYQLNLDDFKMVSMDNIDSALPSPIPLCSVDCSLETIARRGMELLRDRIQGDDRPPKTIVCPVTLMCRNSCQAGK